MGDIDVNGHPTNPRNVELLRLERIWREDERVEALDAALVLCSESPRGVARLGDDRGAAGVGDPDQRHPRLPDALRALGHGQRIADSKSRTSEWQRQDVPRAQKRIRRSATLRPSADVGGGYQNVSKALAGTRAEGSADTIKKSYQLIERFFKSEAPFIFSAGEN